MLTMLTLIMFITPESPQDGILNGYIAIYAINLTTYLK